MADMALKKVYQRGIDRNLELLKKSLMKVSQYNENYLLIAREIFFTSSNSQILKWDKNLKHTRTSFAQEFLAEQYPIEILSVSIYIDVVVNILDDFLDEEMDQMTKTLAIFELVRAIVIVMADSTIPQKGLEISEYLSNLIALAIAEEQIMKSYSELSLSEAISSSDELLTYRALDIEIFIKLPFYLIFDDQSQRTDLLEMGLFFRKINILAKDIHDIEHDLKMGSKSPLLYALQGADYSFETYLTTLSSSLYMEFKKKKGTLNQNTNKLYSTTRRRIIEHTQLQFQLIDNYIKGSLHKS